MAQTISLAMIVRDCADTMGRVLSCVADACDEMIVVDTGSMDDTAHCARSMGATVYDFSWIDDFAAARNFAFSLAKSDWILWLDADDLISAASLDNLLRLKTSLSALDCDAIVLPYQWLFAPSGVCTFSINRERIIRRQANLTWQHAVHETIPVAQERMYFVRDIVVEHRPTEQGGRAKSAQRNLRILELCLSQDGKTDHDLFHYGNELLDLGRISEATAVYQEFIGRADLDNFQKYFASRCLSRCFLESGRAEEALALALSAIELAPKRAEAYNDAGIILYRQNNYQQAVPFFQSAAQMLPPTDCSFVEDSHYMWLPFDYLCSCFTAMRQFDDAVQSAEAALQHKHPERERMEENLRFLACLSTSLSMR